MGDIIAVLLVITAVMCVGYFWVLLALTWLTSAGDFLDLA